MEQNIEGSLQASYADYYALMNNEFDPNAEIPQQDTQSQNKTSYYGQETHQSYQTPAYQSHQTSQIQPQEYKTPSSSSSQPTSNPTPTQSNEVNNTIYISGLSPQITLEELSQHFGSIGVIKADKRTRELKINIYRDRETNEPKGDAILTYDDIEAATAAINWFNDKEFQGKKLHVEYARKIVIPPKGGSGGGRNFHSTPSHKESATPETDWECPSCGNHNWPRRTNCNRCKGPRPEGLGAPQQNSDEGSRGKKPPRSQSSDWACEGCGNVNWGWRSNCNRCSTNRSDGGDEPTQDRRPDRRERETSGRDSFRGDRDNFRGDRDDKRREYQPRREDKRENRDFGRDRERDDRRERERERDRDDRRKDYHKDSSRDRHSEDRRDRRERPY